MIRTTCDSGPAGPTYLLPGSSGPGELHCIRPRPERPTQRLQYSSIAGIMSALRAFVFCGTRVPGPHGPGKGCASPPGLRPSPALRGLVGVACLMMATLVHGQDSSTTPPSAGEVKTVEPASASIELFQQEASEYEITLKNGRPATLNATPVFKWANDVKNNFIFFKSFVPGS